MKFRKFNGIKLCLACIDSGHIIRIFAESRYVKNKNYLFSGIRQSLESL